MAEIEIKGARRLYDRYIKVTLTTKNMTSDVVADLKILKEDLANLNKERDKYQRDFEKGTITQDKLNELLKEWKVKSDRRQSVAWDPSNYMTIDTRAYPVKPSISFSCKRVPGNFAYDITLQIKNLALRKGLSPQDIAYIRVELGYRGGASDVYDFQVLFAYQATPLPNALTVFKGITLSYQLSGFLDNGSNVEIDFTDDFQSEIIDKGITDAGQIVSFVGSKCLGVYQEKVHLAVAGFSAIQVPSSLLEDWPWPTIYTGTSYYDIFRRYMEWVNAFITECTGDTGTVARADIKGATITVTSNYESATPKDIPSENTMPYLLHCKSASLLGNVLTLTTLYDPKITPGTYFYVPLQFYSADKNITSIEKPKGLFRVITSEIEFATVEHSNEMKILAVEVAVQKYLTENNLLAPSTVTPKDTNLIIGKPKDMYEGREKCAEYWQQALPVGNVVQEAIKKRDTLKKIAKRIMGNDVIWTVDEIEEAWSITASAEVPIARDIYAHDFFFLIPLCTYTPDSIKCKKAYEPNSPDTNVLRMMADFATLFEGYSVVVPKITSKTQLLPLKDTILTLLQIMPSMYLNKRSVFGFEDTWTTIYYCLQAGV